MTADLSNWLGADEIETASGLSYNFNDPDPDSIRIQDVAHALSQLCRFNGHTFAYYSVAEHSVLVAELLEQVDYPPAIVKAGLLHDAQEAFTGDYPRPIKHLFTGFKELAAKADLAIGLALDVDPNDFHSGAVKWADDLMLVHEANLLLKNGPGRPDRPLPRGIEINCWEPREAKCRFLTKYLDLV